MRQSKINEDLNSALNETNTYDGLNEKPVIPQRLKRKRSRIKYSPSYIAFEWLIKTANTYWQSNNFAKYLRNLFGEDIALIIINHYSIGTSKVCLGATIFWHRDNWGEVRTGRIIQFNEETGKKTKVNGPVNQWVHNYLNQPSYNYVPCFFAENLIERFSSPVAIVDNERAACIAAAYMPKYTWIASCGLRELTSNKCAVLKNRKVVLYAPLGGYDLWKKVADRENFEISDYLEKIATDEERVSKLDIANYLIRFDSREFRAYLENPIRPPEQPFYMVYPIEPIGKFCPDHFIHEDSDKKWWKSFNGQDDNSQPKPKQRGHTKEFLMKRCAWSDPNKNSEGKTK